MDKIVKLRLQNTIAIVNTSFNGNWTAFAAKIGKARSYVSDIKNGHKLQFTEKLARIIEEKCGLPEKFLDRIPGEKPLEDKVLLIPRLKSSTTKTSKDSSDLFAVDKALIKSLGWTLTNLCILTASGESMSPTIKHNSIALIDTSQTKTLEGKIYALSKNSEIFLRRVFRQIGGSGYEAKSDNEKYGNLAFKDGGNVKVIGRVVYLLGQEV